jgi:N-sulfoglucosamine sulfohydrolase
MPRTNVLFITCHDLGRHLGCYGHPSVASPNLDALAESGVKFDNAFATAPQCSPSRAALHTGRFPHATGVLGLAHAPFDWQLPSQERPIAAILKELDYATALVGMQHLVARDEAGRLGYERVFPIGPALDVTDASVRLLQELAAGDRPFYVEVGFEEPHRPYDFGGAQPFPLPRVGEGGAAAPGEGSVEIPGYLPDCPEARQDFAAFQGAIRAMDAGVGRLLDGLRELDLEANTWVIFTTDHGAAMPRAKGTLYDPGIEVALLMRWPDGGLTGGRAYREMLSNVDIVPTMLDAIGLEQPTNLHGESFWPLLQDAPYLPRTEIFAEKTFHTYYEPMRAVRTATHKYIVNFEISTAVDVPADVRQSPIYPLLIPAFSRERAHVELYDLTTDPWEQTNLAGQPDMADVETTLRHRLLQWMQETQDPLLDGPVASPYYEEAIRKFTVIP